MLVHRHVMHGGFSLESFSVAQCMAHGVARWLIHSLYEGKGQFPGWEEPLSSLTPYLFPAGKRLPESPASLLQTWEQIRLSQRPCTHLQFFTTVMIIFARFFASLTVCVFLTASKANATIDSKQTPPCRTCQQPSRPPAHLSVLFDCFDWRPFNVANIIYRVVTVYCSIKLGVQISHGLIIQRWILSLFQFFFNNILRLVD